MREFARKNLYEWLQRSVLGKRQGAVGRAYLRELADAFQLLNAAYRASNVQIDYATPGFVDAYRLHYLPHYAYTAFKTLEHLPKSWYEAVAARKCVVGVAAAGPLPEVIALSERCAIADLWTGRIELHAFDIAADTWRDAARESVDLASKLNRGVEIDLHYHQADFRQPLGRPIPAFELLTFQHCFNEFAANGTFAPGSLDLVAGIVSGGTLAFSDLTLYEPTVSAILRLETALDTDGWSALARFDATSTDRTPFLKVPYETYFEFYEYDYLEEGAIYRQPRRNLSPRRNLTVSSSVWSRP